MTANKTPAGEGSFGRSTGEAAMRGALLVGVAAVIGLLLLWRGHNNDSSSAQSTVVSTTTTTIKAAASGGTGTGTGATASGTSGTGTKTGATGSGTVSGATASGGTGTVTGGLHKPAEVKVLVANGTGTATGASTVTTRLQPKGYAMLQAADAATANVAVSKVYYRDGYTEDAKQIARDMGVAEPVESVLERMPDTVAVKGATATANVKNANIVVIIGLDKKIPQ